MVVVVRCPFRFVIAVVTAFFLAAATAVAAAAVIPFVDIISSITLSFLVVGASVVVF